MMTYNALLYQHFHIFVVFMFYIKVVFAILYVVKSKDSTQVRVFYFHIKGTTMNYVVLVIRCYSPTTPYSSRPPLAPSRRLSRQSR